MAVEHDPSVDRTPPIARSHDRMLATSAGSPAVRQIAAASLAAVIFCLDAFVQADLAVAGLYTIVMLVAIGRNGFVPRRQILGWASACAALTVSGFVVYQSRGAGSTAAINSLVGLTLIAMTTMRLFRAQAADRLIASGQHRYRQVIDTLAIAIWEHDFTPVAAAIAALREEGVTDIRTYVADHPEFVVEARRMVRITDVNATAVEMMGVPSKDAFFTHLSCFLPETDASFAECIIAIDERRDLFQTETHVTPRSGGRIEILVTFSLGHEADLSRVPGSILDVTRRKRLEAQIARTRNELTSAQRTSAMGAMSAALAHEINQPLSAVQSYSDAATRWLSRPTPDIDEAKDALEGLGKAVNYAREVMRRIRSLIGSTSSERLPVDLGELISETAAVLERDATAYEASIRVSVPSEQVLVSGDRILLKQVIVNLVTNGLQAMSDTPLEERIVDLAVMQGGGEVCLRVIDHGRGWEEVDSADVFQNFYTTKLDGMGLGLSICRTIIDRHEGTITLANAPSGGAAVTVTLPRMVPTSLVEDGSGQTGAPSAASTASINRSATNGFSSSAVTPKACEVAAT